MFGAQAARKGGIAPCCPNDTRSADRNRYVKPRKIATPTPATAPRFPYANAKGSPMSVSRSADAAVAVF